MARWIFGMVGVVLAGALPATGSAQEGPVRFVEVAGAGAVNAAHDAFIIRTSAIGNGATRVAALEAADREIARLRSLLPRIEGVEGLATRMESPEVYAVCDPGDTRPSNRCTIVGYRATVDFELRGAPVARAADVLVVLEDNGFNATGPSFFVTAVEAPGQEAQRLALADARRNAEAIATASNCQLGEPLSIQLNRPPPRDPEVVIVTGTRLDDGTGVRPSFELDLEPGTMQIGALVTARYALVCQTAR